MKPNKPYSTASWPLALQEVAALSHQCSWTHNAPCDTGKGNTDRLKALPQRGRSTVRAGQRKGLSDTENVWSHRAKPFIYTLNHNWSYLKVVSIYITKEQRILKPLSRCLMPTRCRKGWSNERPFMREQKHLTTFKRKIQLKNTRPQPKQSCCYLSLRSNMRRTDDPKTTIPTCHQYAERRFLWLWS